MADPATTRLANSVGYVYKDSDSYTKFEDEEGRDMVTDAYSASQTYNKGALCIYDNKLYKATSAISTAEVWTPDHWSQTDINTELGAVNGAIGSTDISGIGDGSITGALSSLNADRNTYYHQKNTDNTTLTRNVETQLSSYTVKAAGTYFLHGITQFNNTGDTKMDVFSYTYKKGTISDYNGATYMGGRGTQVGKLLQSCGTIVTASVGDVLILSAKATETGMEIQSFVFDCIRIF